MSAAADDLDDGLDYQVDSEEEVEAVEIKEDESEDEVVEDSKKRRKNPTSSSENKLKDKKKQRMINDIEKKKNLPLLNSTELAHHFTTILTKQNKDSTQLDYFKKADFVDGSNYKSPRTLDNFKEFTDKYNKGRLTIIISISRVRIGDLFKSLGPKSNAIKIGKGYDGKIRENTKFIIGTVERVLNMDLEEFEIKSIILDATYQDQKTHSITDEANLTKLLKKYQGTKIILY